MITKRHSDGQWHQDDRHLYDDPPQMWPPYLTIGGAAGCIPVATVVMCINPLCNTAGSITLVWH